jgi:protein-glutamine gamma-glutamyltransferase
MTGFVEAVKRANAPRPPESSARLRLAATCTVAVSLLAAAAEHEISRATSLLSLALVGGGMVFSHRTRSKSAGWVKAGVAIGALAAMGWFVSRLAGGVAGDITTVEDPLTILFAWILVVHSFHVPARRDLVFALAGSAAMMAVAAAQAEEMGFGLYALAWVGCALWTLLEVGASAGGGVRPGVRLVAGATSGVLMAGLVVFLLLPAPTAAVRVDFRSAASSAGPVAARGALAGDTGSPVELSHPGRASSPIRVGGYLGFAGDLDTAIRGQLGRQVVMQVRASVPSFWVGETFDSWSGRNWSSTTYGRQVTFAGGSPFTLPPPPDEPARPGVDDLQTFYIKDATANLVFHADQAEELWFPASKVYYGRDGTIVSPVGMGSGAIYSVDSSVTRPTAAALRAAPPPGRDDLYTQLPQPYTEVRQLVAAVTAGDTNEYDRVQSLISWIGAHTLYSTDIPPLPDGADAVNEFLFGNRTGFCEQISTALTVMLRTAGIPAREAVGYVPGPYNPITDLYEVRAEDAHAWVQVYFPAYGWVDFDPTANVPDANPSPGLTALHIAGRFLSGLAWPQLGAGVGVVASVAVALLALRWKRSFVRLSPSVVAVRKMEKAGRKIGRIRGPSETVVEYGGALGGGWPAVADAIDAAAYGSLEIPRGRLDALISAAQRK